MSPRPAQTPASAWSRGKVAHCGQLRIRHVPSNCIRKGPQFCSGGRRDPSSAVSVGVRAVPRGLGWFTRGRRPLRPSLRRLSDRGVAAGSARTGRSGSTTRVVCTCRGARLPRGGCTAPRLGKSRRGSRGCGSRQTSSSARRPCHISVLEALMWPRFRRARELWRVRHPAHFAPCADARGRDGRRSAAGDRSCRLSPEVYSPSIEAMRTRCVSLVPE